MYSALLVIRTTHSSMQQNLGTRENRSKMAPSSLAKTKSGKRKILQASKEIKCTKWSLAISVSKFMGQDSTAPRFPSLVITN